MRRFLRCLAVATVVSVSAPAFAQQGGGGGGIDNGTGDATARNLPGTVGIGNQTGNGYYTGVGGGERPYYGPRRSYNGRSAYRRAKRRYGDPNAAPPPAYPPPNGYGYGFGRNPY